MTRPWRITRQDSADLGFAWSCLLAGAVTFDEFKAWAEHVVTEMDAEALPPHMIDLMVLQDRRDATVGIRDVVGFWPNDPLLEDRSNAAALQGITARRGTFRAEDAGVSRARALTLLDTVPEIRDRFATVFPFLSLPEGTPA